MGIHEREHLEIGHAQELVAWLELNHASSSGLWVVTFKKSTGLAAPTYDEIVCAILRFGWIDSVPGKVDDSRSKLYISPRKRGSGWSASNKVRIANLERDGLMHHSGLAVVEQARKDGSWDKIDAAQNAEIPSDLITAFASYPGSEANFEAFPRGVRKQILEWILQAKTLPTRAKRIDETARLAQQNERANQWRPKPD